MKISSFFSSEERQSETKSFLSDEEITDKVIEYFTTGNNVARLNMVERGELSEDKFGTEVKEYIRSVYPVDEDTVEKVYQGFRSFVWGYYIIDALIENPDISDIKIYAADRIYIFCCSFNFSKLTSL